MNLLVLPLIMTDVRNSTAKEVTWEQNYEFNFFPHVFRERFTRSDNQGQPTPPEILP